MIVRVARTEDLPAIQAVYKDWTAENIKGIDFELRKDKIQDQLADMVSKNGVIIAELEDKTVIGGIGGFCAPSSFTSDVLFVGIFFYFQPKHRRAVPLFLQMLNHLLSRSQINKLVIAAPPGTGKLYHLLGFKELETHYYKEVTREAQHAG